MLLSGLLSSFLSPQVLTPFELKSSFYLAAVKSNIQLHQISVSNIKIKSLTTVLSGLYFHIGETERKCFIEEIPDETMVTGNYKVLSTKTHSKLNFYGLCPRSSFMTQGLMDLHRQGNESVLRKILTKHSEGSLFFHS